MKRVKFINFILSLVLFLPAFGCVLVEKSDTIVTIDSTKVHQNIVGFGGDMSPVDFSDLNQADMEKILDFAFREMCLNLIRCNIAYHEGASADNFWGVNDNSNPFVINWPVFNFCTKPGKRCNDDWKMILPYFRSLGVKGEYFGLIQGPKWNGFDGSSTFSEDEMVENQLAVFLHFRNDLGITMKWFAPFSEPSGGGINWRITPTQAVNVVKKLGIRLEENGFTDIKMIVPDCTNIKSSITYATAILNDPVARRYVGAIGYHTYATKNGGERPGLYWITFRRRLRDLAASYELPTRMTEYANIRGLMARANHIYNELEYADSQTYFPQRITGPFNRHLAVIPLGQQKESEYASGNIIFYTTREANGRLVSWGPTKYTGVAIGHYSRYARPGSVRLETTSSNRSVRAQAFLDRARNKMTITIINNGRSSERISIKLSGGLQITGHIQGEQTQEGEALYWVPVTSILPEGPATFSVNVPRRSITSLECSLI